MIFSLNKFPEIKKFSENWTSDKLIIGGIAHSASMDNKLSLCVLL